MSFCARIKWLSFPAHRCLSISILIFLALYLLGGILTLPQYGIGWDEGLGSFFFGERYLFYLGSGQEKYLDFDANLAALRNYPLETYASLFRDFPSEYPALVNMPSAGLMHLLGYQLGWLDPVDAFHLLTVLLATGLLAALFFLGAPRYGAVAAGLAVLFLATCPRFWGDMHYNSKDLPETVFFGLAMLALLAWQAVPSWGRVVAAGLCMGAALAIKANAYFIPVIYLLAVLPWSLRRQDWQAALRGLWQRAGQYLVMGLIAVEVFLFSWPYLFHDTPARLRNYIQFVLSQGGREMDSPASLLPLRVVASTLPEWMLLFMGIGLVFLLIEIARGGRFEHRLLLLWLLVPIARVSLPDMTHFDGIRHFMEFLPAAALTAGFGAARLGEWAGRNRPKLQAAAWGLALAGILAGSAWIEIHYRGYEHLYYNTLVGGFSGARERFGENEASDYWAVTYRAGLAWINAHAEPGADLHVPVAGWLVSIPRRAWLRPDLRLISPSATSPQGAVLPERAERPTYVMFIHRPGYYDDLAERLAGEALPAHRLDLDGAPILYIFRLAPGDPLGVNGG